MRLLARIAAAALLAVGPADAASAEIYRWTDAQGNVHFTQDLSQVPASARDAAERSAQRETERSASSPASAAAYAPARSSGRALQIPFEKQGNTMIVYVRINDAITSPFIVDTGAEDVLVPAHLADAAGIQIGRDTPHRTYQTANGLIDTPVVTLASVQVGDARVENVPGTVSGAMKIGLLGGTFFNNFTFQIDPAANVITLFPNAHVRGGANQAEWQGRFRELRGLIAALDAFVESELSELTNPARVRVLEKRREELAAALEDLDAEANSAGVPQAWRD